MQKKEWISHPLSEVRFDEFSADLVGLGPTLLVR